MVFAERMMDQLSIKLGVDPLTIRKRNFYKKGRDITPYGQQVRDNVIRKLVLELEKSSDYQQRRKDIVAFNRKNKFLKKGIALTPVKFGIAFTLMHLNQAGALVHVYTDGSVQVNHGGTEMGQGLNLKVAQVVAEEFGIDIAKVQITATTTDKVPNTTPTAASSGSDLNGMAAKNAAEKIRKRMVKFAAKYHGVDARKISFSSGQVSLDGKKIPLQNSPTSAFSNAFNFQRQAIIQRPKSLGTATPSPAMPSFIMPMAHHAVRLRLTR